MESNKKNWNLLKPAQGSTQNNLLIEQCMLLDNGIVYSGWTLMNFIFSILLIGALLISSSCSAQSGQYVSIADSKLFYKKMGHGPSIIFLHGGLVDNRMWENQIEQLSKDYTVVLCDLRGHGKTIDGDSSYYMDEGLRILMDSIGIKKASFLGFSLGAMVALDFALNYPERLNQLILISPGLSGSKSNFPEDSVLNRQNKLMGEALKAKNNLEATGYFLQMWYDGPLRSLAETDTLQREKAFQMVMDFFDKHRFIKWVKLRDAPTETSLKAIAAPTLIILGNMDQPVIFRNANFLKTVIPNLKIEKIMQSAHMVNMEKPKEVNELLLEFLDHDN